MYEIKIGVVIQRLIWKMRKNLKEISRETGIPYSTLHTWQLNRQPKDIVKAQQLADYFEISLHELLFDKPDNRKKEPNYEIPKLNGEEFFKGRFEILVKKLD